MVFINFYFFMNIQCKLLYLLKKKKSEKRMFLYMKCEFQCGQKKEKKEKKEKIIIIT